ncbi:MAG: hypothetical protein FWF52_03090 [Candidatus Azobacteroides sp.]|nr:hypothetical protein [Candidatus Azobacteroides sp.]
MSRRFKDYLFGMCGILLLFSAIFYIAGWKFIPYIYTVSGVGLAVIFLASPYKGDNFRLKRLNIQQAIAALLLPISSYWMFKNRNEWIICLLISAILQLYVIFVREYEEKKEKKNKEEG